VLVVGCGGGSPQDAHEAQRSYAVQVTRASFPRAQAVARPASLELQVRNTGSRTVPNIAISLDSLNYASSYPNLAARQRPVWVIERGPGAVARNPPVQTEEVSTPGGASTAYVNTWALGPLAPGHTQTFTWHVVAVKPGTHTVHYTVAAGLAGKATARLSSGGAATGSLTADVAGEPPNTHVDPATGQVVTGTFNGVP
jgi:hypothetical protein